MKFLNNIFQFIAGHIAQLVGGLGLLGSVAPNIATITGDVGNFLSGWVQQESNYVNNQTAIIAGQFSHEGVPGDIIALSKTAQQNPIPPGATTVGQALGLS